MAEKKHAWSRFIVFVVVFLSSCTRDKPHADHLKNAKLTLEVDLRIITDEHGEPVIELSGKSNRPIRAIYSVGTTIFSLNLYPRNDRSSPIAKTDIGRRLFNSNYVREEGSALSCLIDSNQSQIVKIKLTDAFALPKVRSCTLVGSINAEVLDTNAETVLIPTELDVDFP